MKTYLYNNHVVLDFPFSYELKDKVKNLFPKKVQYNEVLEKKWTISIPFIAENEERIQTFFDFCQEEGFEVPQDVEFAIRNVKDSKDELRVLSKSVESEFDVQGLFLTLRPYQKAAIEYCVKTKKCIIGHGVRLGKSATALASVHHLKDYPVLIVCKNGLMINWKNEIEKVLGNTSIYICSDIKKGVESGKDFVIANPEKLSKLEAQLLNYKFKGLIYDEFHSGLGNKSSAKYKSAKKIAKKCDAVYALSGTPIRNAAHEMVDVLNFIGKLDDFGGWYTFIHEYYDVTSNAFSKFVLGKPKNLNKLHERLTSTCMVRKTWEEVFDEVPQKSYYTVEVPISNWADYNKLADETVTLQTKIKQNLFDISHLDKQKQAQAKFTHRQKTLEYVQEWKGKLFELRRVLGLGKVEAIAEWAEDFISNGEHLILFANHIDVQKELVKRFPKAAKILGIEKSREERERNRLLFQNGKTDLIICSLMAASEGLDLSRGNTMGICELGWTPTAMEQAIGRMGRVGKLDPQTIYTFIGEKTIDIRLADMLKSKGVEGNLVTDGYVNEDSYVESLLETL